MLLTGSNNQFWIAESNEKRINFCSNCSFVKILNRSFESGCLIRWKPWKEVMFNEIQWQILKEIQMWFPLALLKMNAKLELYHVNAKRHLTIISSWVNSVGEFGCQYASLTRSAGLLRNFCKPSNLRTILLLRIRQNNEGIYKNMTRPDIGGGEGDTQ